MGYPKPIPDKPHQARTRVTVQMQLREFKSTVRGVYHRGNYNQPQSDLLKPIKVTHSRFMTLGLQGKYQAPCLALILLEQLRSQIENHLIRLGHTISNRQIITFKNGQIALEPNLPNLNGRVGWDSNLKGIRALEKRGTEIPPIDQHSHTIQQPCPICLGCTTCKASTLSNGGIFQLEDLDKHNKCNSCKVSSKIRDWTCSCQTPWHLCNVHQSCATYKDKILPYNKPSKGVKRPLGPLHKSSL